MPIDRTKTFNGPATITLQTDVPADIISWATLKKDVISLTITQKEIADELEDDSTERHLGGIDLELKIPISEMDEADWASIISATLDSLKIEFTAKSMSILIEDIDTTAGDVCYPLVENFKTVLVLKKSYPIGTDLSDIVVLA